MKTTTRLWLYGSAVLLFVALAQSQTTEVVHGPTESKHQAGPGGLEAWTLDYVVPGETESYPEILVIARNGRILRKIDGNPFIWSWKFFANGQQIGYEIGPLHFEVTCVLLDLSTGKHLADYDCYHELPKPTPSWVKDLQNLH
jgi:hypothetical protein